MKNGKPAISSSIDLFDRSGINFIMIVVPPHSAIPDVVENVYPDKSFVFVIQPELTGVPHAFALAIQNLNVNVNATCVMSCCDNVYDERTTIEYVSRGVDVEMPKTMATVRRCPAWQRPYLSMYNPGAACWTLKCDGDLCIAGWWIMPLFVAREGKPGQTTIDFLNECKAEPHELPADHEWWDIGVLEPYVAYWRNGSCVATDSSGD